MPLAAPPPRRARRRRDALPGRCGGPAQIGARSARGVPGVSAPVQRLPRPAPAAPAALLLDLLVAAPGRASLQHHRRGAGGGGALGPRTVRRRVLQSPGAARRGQRGAGVRQGHALGIPSPRPPGPPAPPIIRVGPGTGLAPFRGFLQERAALAAQGRAVGPAVLFSGCRHPEQDFLYEVELRAFAERGVATLHPCFSRVPDRPRVYVQDEILARRDAVWGLLEAGGGASVWGGGGPQGPGRRGGGGGPPPGGEG